MYHFMEDWDNAEKYYKESLKIKYIPMTVDNLKKLRDTRQWKEKGGLIGALGDSALKDDFGATLVLDPESDKFN